MVSPSPPQICICIQIFYLSIHTYIKKTPSQTIWASLYFLLYTQKETGKKLLWNKKFRKSKNSFSPASALPFHSCTKHLKHEKVLSCCTAHLLIFYLHIPKRTADSSCVGATHPSWPMGRGTSQSHAQPGHKTQRPPLCYSDVALLCVCDRALDAL